MNLIVLNEQDFIAGTTVVLKDERFKQICNVHRSVVGDSVRVGKLGGLMGTAVIKQMDNTAVTLAVELTQPPPQKLPLTVILALPRPKMIRRILRSVTELGVQRLIVINSYKVEKSFWNSPALEQNNVQNYLVAGLQQAKDTMLPEVSFERLFKPFVEDELPDIVRGSTALISHPGTNTPCPHALNQPTTLAIGPEGGFTDYEVRKFIDVGFQAIHLGQRILRVENAVTALVSKLYG